jgi:hypothetical protein
VQAPTPFAAFRTHEEMLYFSRAIITNLRIENKEFVGIFCITARICIFLRNSLPTDCWKAALDNASNDPPAFRFPAAIESSSRFNVS